MDKVNMVPGFILKLWKMINDPQCDDLISWSDNGQSFIIMDPNRFSQELSKYFKHNNLSSFIRQLNMYGFRKVATIENSGLHPGNDDLHFYHPDFVRGKPELLEAIKRKLPQKLADSVDLRNVIKGISDIEDKHNGVSKTLSEIKRENEMLWAELHDLRQKHQQQQLYISRLMKLVFEAMEQNGIKTNLLPIKPQPALMIEGLSDSDNQMIQEVVGLVNNQFEPSNQNVEAGNVLYQTSTSSPAGAGGMANNDMMATESVPAASSSPPEVVTEFVTPISPSGTSPTATTTAATTSSLATPQIYSQDLSGEEPTHYQTLVESINLNGDQIDSLIPDIMDFNDENMVDYFTN